MRRSFDISEYTQRGPVYLDSSIVSRDMNHAEDREYSFGVQCARGELTAEVLERQLSHARRLNLRLGDIAMRSSPSIIREYGAFLGLLQRMDVPEEGQQQFSQILRFHESNRAIMRERSPPKSVENLIDYILEEQMYLRVDGIEGKNEPSEADAELFAYALTDADESGDAAVITTDVDILNMAKNYAQRLWNGDVPKEFPLLDYGQLIRILFPDPHEWVPGMKLRAMTMVSKTFRERVRHSAR